jgi:predicted nucleotidyltransferase
MNPSHGLTNKLVAQITGVLSQFPDVERAVLFGSRAKGTFRPGSDIDLALVGKDLNWRTIGKIYDALDDLLLPYRFSLINFDRETDPEVAAHIARVGVPLFQRERSVGALMTK